MVQSSVQRLFPKAEDLLRMPFEQLAPTLLKLAYEQRQQAGFIPHAVCDVTIRGISRLEEGRGRDASHPCLELDRTEGTH